MTFYRPNKYTARAQEILGSATKPEDWLHVILMVDSKSNLDKIHSGILQISYAIYVWDTREVVESGMVEVATRDFCRNWFDFQGFNTFGEAPKIPVAIDNHKPLVSQDKIVSSINIHYFNKQRNGLNSK